MRKSLALKVLTMVAIYLWRKKTKANAYRSTGSASKPF